jgi:hypothetical protein
MVIYFENEENKALRVLNGIDRILFNSKEDEIKLLSKKLMNNGRDISD